MTTDVSKVGGLDIDLAAAYTAVFGKSVYGKRRRRIGSRIAKCSTLHEKEFRAFRVMQGNLEGHYDLHGNAPFWDESR